MGFIDFTSKFFKRNKQNEETEEMREKKEKLMETSIKVKKLEQELSENKFLERKNRIYYQNACPHRILIPMKNNDNSTTFNDYTAKCELCEAQLWNKNRSIAYLYSLIDLLNKFPKVNESLKIIDLIDDNQLLNNILDLVKDLSQLKEKLNDLITEKEFNEKLKIRYKNKEINE